MAYEDKEQYNLYMKDYMLKRYHRRREQALQALGGKCIVCNNTKDLEFDHIDPAQKTANIAKIWSYKQEKFQQELSLCQLLCKECHILKSIEDSGKQVAQHGTLSIRNCKCDLCRLAKNDYMKNWKRKKRQAFVV